MTLRGIRNITRTGHFYGHDKVALEKLLTPTDEERPSREIEKGTSSRNANRPLTEKEASEFLKFVKHNEYNIIEQLNKTLVKISLLSLFQNSKPHCNALLKVLSGTYVAQNIFVDVDQLIENIIASTCISFTDEEIALEGRGSVKALHINVKCKSYIIPRALIDNGSSLNVISMSTLSRLPVDLSYMKKVKWLLERLMVQEGRFWELLNFPSILDHVSSM